MSSNGKSNVSRISVSLPEPLLVQLDDPQARLRGVLIGGTNGKGSVAAMVAAVMAAASPELMCHGISGAAELAPLLSRATVVAIGPGLGSDEDTEELVAGLIKKAEIPPPATPPTSPPVPTNPYQDFPSRVV